MIGFEDEPGHSGEICVCEIFGSDVGPASVRVGMAVHPFADGIYEFGSGSDGSPADAGAPEFVVDSVRGYRPASVAPS